MKIAEAGGLWFAALRRRRRSEKTIEWYAMWLRDLSRSLMLARPLGFDDVAHVSLADLRAWVDGLTARGLKPHSIHGAARAARAFFRWCLAEGLRADDPTLRLERPDLPRRIPKPLPVDVVQQLINVAAGSTHAARDQALVMFLADTGVRLGELCGLQVGDVDLAGCSAVVVGKGDQERFVFFSDETRRALMAWLVVRPPGVGNLFGLGYYAVGGLLRRLADRACVAERVHPHAFRKTAATRYAEQLDPHALMQLFGWKQLQTSEHYVYHSRARLAARARAVLEARPTD